MSRSAVKLSLCIFTRKVYGTCNRFKGCCMIYFYTPRWQLSCQTTKLLSKAKKYLWVKKLNFFCGQVQIIFCSHPPAKGHQSAADFSQPLIMALLYIYKCIWMSAGAWDKNLSRADKELLWAVHLSISRRPVASNGVVDREKRESKINKTTGIINESQERHGDGERYTRTRLLNLLCLFDSCPRWVSNDFCTRYRVNRLELEH